MKSAVCPLDLPEIRFYIGQFLSDHKDLASCTRVSRAWQVSFTPLLWRTFTLKRFWDPNHYTCSQSIQSAIQRNAIHMRSLTIEATTCFGELLDYCTQLKTLVVIGIGCESLGKSFLWAQLTALVQRNPSIEWIILGMDLQNGPSTEFLKVLPTACPNLKRYESSRCKYEGLEQVEALMQLMTQVEAMCSRYERYVDIPLGERYTFPHLSDLTLKDAQGLSIQSQVELVCRCPNLVTVRWTVGKDNRFPVESFCQQVPKSCPKLTGLHMDGCGIGDPDDVAKVLFAMKGLKELTLYGSIMSNKIFGSLRQHFSTLRMLDLMYGYNLQSEMVQEILESCPDLATLKASTLKMADIVRGKKWACLGLKHLELTLTAQSSSVEDQWMTFEQLSQLERLEFLAIGSTTVSRRRREGLRFSMESGVDRLATLTRLRHLSLKGSVQVMHLEDVDWMLRALTKLKFVAGKFHPQLSRHHELESRLREHGIEVPLVDWEEYHEMDMLMEDVGNYDNSESEEEYGEESDYEDEGEEVEYEESVVQVDAHVEVVSTPMSVESVSSLQGRVV